MKQITIEQKIQRLHTKFVSSNNGKYTVIKYIDASNIIIKFEDDNTEVKTTWSNAKNGLVKNPNKTRLIENIGYIGKGKYNINSKYYNIWKNMFVRCYNKKFINNNPTYKNCIVDKQWHNFQNFADWCEENYIDVFEIDKDIFFKIIKFIVQIHVVLYLIK